MDASARRLALLVGIDRYPNFRPREQLRSCANDARLMAEVLHGRFGFAWEDLTLLADEAATRDAILAGLAALQARARPGDAVVFFYSGHGSQVVDREGDEPNGWDESIVPHDGGRHPHPFRDITDDELYEWVLAVSEVTPNVAVIADTCYSGTIAREGPAKWLRPDGRGIRELPPSPVNAALFGRRVRDIGPSGLLPIGERYVLLAACREGEGATELPQGVGARSQSTFTFHLCQALQQAPLGATYRDLLEPVRAAVAASAPGQTPQLEGARDRRLFGLEVEPPAGQPLRPSSGAIPAGAEALAADPEPLAHYRNLLRLEDDDPANPLRGCLEVQLLRFPAEGTPTPAQPDPQAGQVVYRDGDRLGVRILHRHSEPLYVHVLDLGLTGAVSSLYPVRGANELLLPGRELLIGVRGGDEVEVRIPAKFATPASGVPPQPRQGVEYLKVFATPHETDLTWLEQSAPSARSGETRWTVKTVGFLVREKRSARGA